MPEFRFKFFRLFLAKDPSSDLVFGLAVDFNPGLLFGPEEGREDDSDPTSPRIYCQVFHRAWRRFSNPGLVFGLDDGLEADSEGRSDR